ncbi:corrinoid protein [Desulfurococcaceae archaeon MEX13E-LK6-19]|nr:corrinoid protein [Desulfurococcaceae archaeon MEX13E-LK6-19]
MLSNILDEIKNCLIDLDADCVEESVEKALNEGYSATDIMLGPMSKAMDEIGKLYEEGEYFIAELLEAAEIFKSVFRKLEPLLQEESRSKGVSSKSLTIVIGTVKGDIHDIGKTIVAVMLQAAGHKVIDLGVDVDADKFIEAIRKHDADVLGMSALLTTTIKYMKTVIDRLVEENLRDKVFVIIGGAATTPEFAREIGADAWARDAVEAVKIINEYAEKKYGRKNS